MTSLGFDATGPEPALLATAYGDWNPMPLKQHVSQIGSGTVVGLGMLGTALVLILLCQTIGWDPTWRTFGVTPLQPPFFDMHVINDYAACAWKGADAYAPHACNVDNYNYPP